MTRWKASATHLCLSAVVIGIIALGAFLLWYPHALYRVAGLDRILVIMLGIDLTAGPLLTLIVYRADKPSLKFDLSVIAIAQMAFLAYGLQTLWLGRPVFLVGTPDTFTLVFANEINDEELLPASSPSWRRLSWTGPELVATSMPTDPKLRKEAMDDFLSSGVGIERTPRRYREYGTLSPTILRNAHPVIGARAIPESEVRATGMLRAQLRWVPVVSRRGSAIMLIDARKGLPQRTVDIDPDSLSPASRASTAKAN